MASIMQGLVAKLKALEKKLYTPGKAQNIKVDICIYIYI
jgi:hypothetical protein